MKAIAIRFLLTFGLLFSAEAQAAERPPNIVLIVADDLGWGDLGCYGQERIRTPNLNRLAAQGTRFTRFYAGSTVCAPSRSVLMTGKHMGRTTVRGNAGRGNAEAQTLRDEDVTLAEMLKERGYRTGLFGKWGLGEEGTSGAPTRQGFDAFYGYLNQRHAHNYYPAILFRGEEIVRLENEVPGPGKFGGGVATRKAQYAPDLILGKTLEWLDDSQDQPFFLFFASTIPHANNEAGRKGMEIPSDAPYSDKDWPQQEKNKAAMITRLDRDVGIILDKLKEMGVAERTFIFFTSDNGPHKEGGANPAFHQSSGPLRGIKRDLYEGGIRVPLIAWGPGVQSEAVTDHVAYFGDFFATFADIAGADAPEGLDSISFLPTLRGNPAEQKKHEYLYWEFHERGFTQGVLIEGRWKGIRLRHRQAPIELYDLKSDPAERNDVASAHPDKVARVEELFEQAHESNSLWPIRERRN